MNEYNAGIYDTAREIVRKDFTSTAKKVKKGVWRMPRLSEAKKDVISCDKLRRGANIL